MGRKAKDPALKMSTDLRIPVTEAQKEVILQAVADDPDGMAAWARGVLLQAAETRIAQTDAKKTKRKTAK